MTERGKANRLELNSVDLTHELDRYLDMFCIAYGVRLESRNEGVAIVHHGHQDACWNNLTITEEK